MEATKSSRNGCDVLIVGGGPSGAIAGIRAVRRGLRATVLEKAAHPRFHVGESLLPRMMMLLQELGLEGVLDGVPHTPKLGASFAMGDDTEPTDFPFSSGLVDAPPDTLNVERAGFDRALMDAAVAEGVTLLEDTEVRRIEALDDSGVRLAVRGADGERTLSGRCLIDASGEATVVGRHLKTRKRLPDLERVAYFGHFEGVERRAGEPGGFPLIVMCREGWFWLIPLDARRTSIGLVMDASVAKGAGVPSKRRLAWGIANSPLMRRLTRNAIGPDENGVIADFGYTCRPYAGPGYFLVGDAATFIDPIFSTGVTMGMMSAVRAADAVKAIVDGAATAPVRRDYDAYITSSSSAFFRLVRGYYRHAFREMFLNCEGPLAIHRAIISVLCGHVFPRPPFALRWRLRLFDLLMRIQPIVPLVPHRAEFSLFEHAATGGSAAGLRATKSMLE